MVATGSTGAISTLQNASNSVIESIRKLGTAKLLGVSISLIVLIIVVVMVAKNKTSADMVAANRRRRVAAHRKNENPYNGRKFIKLRGMKAR
jgi:hypothetical protein